MDEQNRANPFDTENGYSGQDYHRAREAELAAQGSAGRDGQPAADDDATPPEAGKRAHIDPATGAVHGAGAGAGGGNAGEDYDDDATGGSGYPRTGVDGEGPVIEASGD
ncbi:hypothetical protein [Sphingomonas turrisvirgatae]|uniref:Uncharacterized protein n=1 Tax=Sphingomonas turrisvirgatae TaxID=1888892 RepID=A0A1E3LU60_9SPHN|nr:hypothetical protein [Sphingomonas turrisvirgatae]ODP37264.1 hypothetical protein BFL28_03340 [Sphingomonas turrisvirgatae]